MKFRFPIIIIDEDFRSENASGLGIRALADAIEKEGMEILGVTSYGDLTSFAQQQSRASAFLLSIDDEEFGGGSAEETEVALKSLRAFVQEIRFKNADISDLPVRRDAHFAAYPERHPARTSRLHPHARGHAGIRGAPHHSRGQGLSGFVGAAVLPRLVALRTETVPIRGTVRDTRAAWHS